MLTSFHILYFQIVHYLKNIIQIQTIPRGAICGAAAALTAAAAVRLDLQSAARGMVAKNPHRLL